MNDNDPKTPGVDMTTAYRIITSLVEALTASSDLIARMAQLMGEDAARPLQQDPAWHAYLEAKRRLEKVHDDMHRFAEAASAQIELENARAARAEESAGETGSTEGETE